MDICCFCLPCLLCLFLEMGLSLFFEGTPSHYLICRLLLLWANYTHLVSEDRISGATVVCLEMDIDPKRIMREKPKISGKETWCCLHILLDYHQKGMSVCL